MSSKLQKVNKEVIIIGGGPAGLKAAEIAKQKKLDYVVLEKGKPGQAWADLRPDMLMLSPCLPQRDWTSLSTKLPIWKMDVQRPYCTAQQFAKYLEAYCDFFQLDVQTHQPAMDVERTNDGQYVVQTKTHEYSAPVLMVGTGIFGNPYFPDIPGIKNNPHVMHAHSYRNKMDFKNQRVLIVGGGNSAAETAIDLVGYSLVYLITRDELKFFSDTKKLYHIRGVYESYLQELISMEIIRYKAYQQITHIEENVVHFRNWQLEVDKVIFATGYHGDLKVLNNFKPRVNRRNFPEVTESGESIQYPRLFFVGPLFSQSMSTNVIHGFVKLIPKTIESVESLLKTC